MTQHVGIRLGAAVFIVLTALQLGGCGDPTLKSDETAKTVTDFVSQKTKFKPTDVSCPSGLKAKVGEEFDCHFTGPDGPYTAHMKVTKIDGDNVEFDINTYLSQ